MTCQAIPESSVAWFSETPYQRWCLAIHWTHSNPDSSAIRIQHASFFGPLVNSLSFLIPVWLGLFLTLTQAIGPVCCWVQSPWGKLHVHWQAIYRLSYQISLHHPHWSELISCWQNTNSHPNHHSMCPNALCKDNRNYKTQYETWNLHKQPFHLSFCAMRSCLFQCLKKKIEKRVREQIYLPSCLVFGFCRAINSEKPWY